MNNKTPFFERLKIIIDACGRRKDAAMAAGVSVDQIARYLRGENQPTIQAVTGLCNATGYSADWLISGRGDEKKRASILIWMMKGSWFRWLVWLNAA